MSENSAKTITLSNNLTKLRLPHQHITNSIRISTYAETLNLFPYFSLKYFLKNIFKHENDFNKAKKLLQKCNKIFLFSFPQPEIISLILIEKLHFLFDVDVK